MKKITIKLQFIEFDINEILQHLKSIKGIIDVNLNTDTNELYIEYARNNFSLNQLKEELNDFIPLPATLGFDKHSEKKTGEYTIIVKDIFCEYCSEGIILKLMTIDGIESCYTNFDYDVDYEDFDINLSITYDKSILSREDIIKLEKELNN